MLFIRSPRRAVDLNTRGTSQTITPGNVSTWTFSNQDLEPNPGNGIAIAVIALTSGSSSGAPTITSVTIDGQSATILVENSAQRTANAIAIATGVTATTGDVVASAGSSFDYEFGFCRVYRKIGGTNKTTAQATDSASSDGTGTINLSVNVAANGGVIAIAQSRNSAGITTGDLSTNTTFEAGVTSIFLGSDEIATTQTPLSMTFTQGGGNNDRMSGVAVSFDG